MNFISYTLDWFSLTLQGKYLLAEVIMKVFRFIKLEKKFKKSFVIKVICGIRCFNEIDNEISSQLKKFGWP